MSLATPETSDNEEGNTTSVSQHHHVDSQDALQAANNALERLKALLGQSNAFEPAATHRDVPVWVLEAPIPGGHHREQKLYRASATLAVKPSEVYRHVREPTQWDDWKPETKMVDDVDDDSSLLYTVLDVPGSSQQIDTATVERVSQTPEGGILHVATSISSDQIPLVQGRHRASIALQAWAITPRPDESTEVVYFIQLADRTLRHPYKLSMRRQSISKHASYSVANLVAAVGQSSGVPSAPDSPASSHKGRPDRKRMLSLTASSFRKRNKSGRGHLSMLRKGGSSPNLDSTPASSTTSLSPAPAAAAVFEQPKEAAAPVEPEVDTDASRPHLPEEAASDSTLDHLYEEFAQALKQSASWSVASTTQGQRIWTSDVQGHTIPKVKVETVVKGNNTEAVLAAITSAVARKTWQQHFRSSTFDGSRYMDSYSGLYPHLQDFQTITQRSIRRSRTDSVNPHITFVSKSPDADPAQVVLNGWQLQPKGRDVVVRHIVHMTVGQNDLPAYIGKVLAAEMAADLGRLKELVERSKIPPSFVRWGLGPRYLKAERSEEANHLIFESEPGSPPSSKDQQKTWLSIHQNPAFMSGADLSCDLPKAIASVASISEFPGLWQLTWSAEETAPATVLVKPAQVERGLLSWKGAPVTEAVMAPRRTAAQGEEPEQEEPEEVEEDQTGVSEAALGAGAVAGAAGVGSVPTTSEKEKSAAQDPRSVDTSPSQANQDVLAQVKSLTPTQVYFIFVVAFLSFLSGVYFSTVYSTR